MTQIPDRKLFGIALIC